MTTNSNKSYIQWIYAGISISIFLFFLVILFLVYYFTQNYLESYNKELKFAVEFTESTKAKDIENVKLKIAQADFYLDKSIELISKDSIRSRFAPILEDSLSDYFSLPFRDVLFFSVKKEYLTGTKSLLVKSTLLKERTVRDVYFQKNNIQGVQSFVKKVYFGLSLFSVILLLMSTIFLYNTIRSTLNSRREIITNQLLLGASRGFIARPILLSSFITAVLSSFFSISLVGLIYLVLKNSLDINIALENNYPLYLFILMTGIILIIVLFTWIILRNNLKMSL